MTIQFKVGDVVQLKTGGAKMLVHRIFTGYDDNELYADCVWHSGSRPYRKIYLLAVLVSLENEPSH